MAEEIQTPTKRKKILKRLRNILIGSLILLIILVTAGAIYTWYMGQNTPIYREDNASESKTYSDLKPTVNNDPNQAVGVAIQSMSSPVAPGSEVFISVRTTPGANCKISVEYNKDTVETMKMKVAPMSGPDLIDKKADDWGIVNWSWDVPTSAKIGKWYTTVSCYKGSKWANAVGDLIVKNS